MADKQQGESSLEVEQKVAKEREVIPPTTEEHQTPADSKIRNSGVTDQTVAESVTTSEVRRREQSEGAGKQENGSN